MKDRKTKILSFEVSKDAVPTQSCEIGATFEIGRVEKSVALLDPAYEPGMRGDLARFVADISARPSVLGFELCEPPKFSRVSGHFVDENGAISELAVKRHLREPCSVLLVRKIREPERTFALSTSH
ncbi:MAG: hypothetical protein ACHQPI_04450 [Thermoanaerobaculia bacterium]